MFDRTCTQRNKSSPRENWVTIERRSSRRWGEFPAYMPPEVLWTGLTIVKCAAGYNSSPSCDGSRVFEISTGFKTAWGHILKRAKIVSFRWHALWGMDANQD